VFGFLACMRDGSRGSVCSNAVTLIFWQDQPADFVNCLVPPGLSPIANVAHANSIGTPDDPEHVVCSIFREMQVALMPSEDLFRAFRSSEVSRHLRVTQKFLKQLQVRL
jgi:hypothetical protein